MSGLKKFVDGDKKGFESIRAAAAAAAADTGLVPIKHASLCASANAFPRWRWDETMPVSGWQLDRAVANHQHSSQQKQGWLPDSKR